MVSPMQRAPVRGIRTALLAAAACALAAGDAGAQVPRVALTTAGLVGDEDRRARLRTPGYDGWAAVRLRGQSSRTFPKQSFSVELRTAAGEDRDAPLLGLPLEDDFVLAAGHPDKTLLRNVVALRAAARLGTGWAPQARLVEVVLNGRTQGVYTLAEKVELGKRRITGARALGELTFRYQARRKGDFFTTPVKRQAVHEADGDGAALRRAVGAAERALYRGRPGAWRAHLDAAAAVDAVLVQELFKNVDAFRASSFMVLPDRGPLRLGPAWDMDLAMGNARQHGFASPEGWATRRRVWASRLHADPGFRAALAARWRALRAAGHAEALLADVGAQAAALRDAGAAGRTFRRWPILDRRVFQEPAVRGTWTAEVAALRRWLQARVAWLDRVTAGG
jgi:hypothetical protein